MYEKKQFVSHLRVNSSQLDFFCFDFNKKRKATSTLNEDCCVAGRKRETIELFDYLLV